MRNYAHATYPPRGRRVKKVAIALIVLFAVSFAAPRESVAGDPVSLAYLAIVFAPPIGFSIYNGVVLADDRNPGLFPLVGGFLSGLPLIAVGGIGLVDYSQGGDEIVSPLLMTGLGMASMTLALLAMVNAKEKSIVTKYGRAAPELGPSWHITPTAMPDSRGNMTAGLGLMLTGF